MDMIVFNCVVVTSNEYLNALCFTANAIPSFPTLVELGYILYCFCSLSLLNEQEKMCDVVVDKINNQRVVVKIVIPSNLAPSLLKFDKTMLHKRKLKVFQVAKCTLGTERILER